MRNVHSVCLRDPSQCLTHVQRLCRREHGVETRQNLAGTDRPIPMNANYSAQLDFSHRTTIRYDGLMACVRRFAAAVVLIAFAAAPVLANWCAAECETAGNPRMPACHDGMSPPASTVANGQAPVPVPCGHDHHPITVNIASVKPLVTRTVAVVYAIGGLPAQAMVGALGSVDARGRNPSSPALRLALSSTLRI